MASKLDVTSLLFAVSVLLHATWIGAQLTSDCVNVLDQEVCTIQNWNGAGVGRNVTDGLVVNVTVPTNTLVSLRFNCSDLGDQVIALTSKEGFETCNATVHPISGLKYNVPSAPTSTTTVSPGTCATVLVKIYESISFLPSNRSVENYYFVNTAIQNTSFGLLEKLNNRMGGACLLGVKLRLMVTYQDPSPTGSPSPGGTSGASRLVAPAMGYMHSYVFHAIVVLVAHVLVFML